MKAGAEIFFSSCLIVHNLRYNVVDERIIVLGMRKRTGEKEATKKGYPIPSEGLATLMKNYFNSCEDKTNLKDSVQEVLKHSRATLNISRESSIRISMT